MTTIPPTTTSAAEPLVSDHDLHEAANAAAKEWLLGNIGVPRVCEKQLFALRDQYEKATNIVLAVAKAEWQRQTEALQSQLDAARAGSFVPLPDGEYTMPAWDGSTYTLHVTSKGADLEAWADGDENEYKDGSPKRVEEIGVGEYRLCQLQPASTGSG